MKKKVQLFVGVSLAIWLCSEQDLYSDGMWDPFGGDRDFGGGAQHGGAQHGGAQHGGAQHGGAQNPRPGQNGGGVQNPPPPPPPPPPPVPAPVYQIENKTLSSEMVECAKRIAEVKNHAHKLVNDLENSTDEWRRR